jgi:acetoin utilization deacetylase AcuC-like enzyme
MDDFRIAHTKEYVDAFFNGTQPLCSSSGLFWSEELAESVCYTNSSLYHAIKFAVTHPERVCFSPVSGFHHANPGFGEKFCSASGQVIASVKVFRETGKRGAYLDLDGHFGNSIEDSRTFVPDLNEAVPPGFNFNPKGVHKRYISSLKYMLSQLEKAVLSGKIQYVVFCHGADSHVDDDLSGKQCSTAEWLECSLIFYGWVARINLLRPLPLPVILTLFGGYRAGDQYNSVLALHTADLVVCLNTLCGHNIQYLPEVKDSDSL